MDIRPKPCASHNRPQNSPFGRRQEWQVPAAPFLLRPLSRAVLLVRRPATSLRTKTKSENGLLRAVGCRGSSNAPSAARGFLGRTKRLRLKHYGLELMNAHGRNDVAVSDVTDAPSADATERLMTVSELAGQLRYSPGWVRERVRAGEIPCIRVQFQSLEVSLAHCPCGIEEPVALPIAPPLRTA